jgi:hypothetical protein
LSSENDISLTLDDLHAFYNGYFPYYGTLNDQWQKVFNTRCKKFIIQKAIIGAEDFEPNNKVKAIIAACAVQLTLGLEKWDLLYFETIIVHPKDFDNKASGLKFKGETNLAGFIRLSWKDFILGYKINDDNVNLGLHEFAHALRFNGIKYDFQDYFVEHYFSKWQSAAMEAYLDIKNGRETIFRKYGGANMNEFLCVCIEHFFESPEEIKKQYPQLFYSTAILLNQTTQNNYTQLNVREKLFLESSLLLPGFVDRTFKTAPLQATPFSVGLIIMVPLIYTIILTGFFSALSIFLFILLFTAYLHFDFHFTKIVFIDKGLYLNKGFFLLKNWRKLSISISQLVSVRLYNTGEKDNEWEILFYNTDNGSFYEETIPTYEKLDTRFLKELNANKVAYFRS